MSKDNPTPKFTRQTIRNEVLHEISIFSIQLILSAILHIFKRYKQTNVMPSIVYAGVKYTQTRHAIHCKKCLDTIESKYASDFKSCSCGATAIDGGISEGNRILGNLCHIEDRSIYCAIVGNKKIWLPQAVVEEYWSTIVWKSSASESV